MSGPTDFETDFLRACQYAYYVKHMPILEDYDFDMKEAEYELDHDPLPIGSDRPEHYTDAQRALALYFLMSGRHIAKQVGEELL